MNDNIGTGQNFVIIVICANYSIVSSLSVEIHRSSFRFI